MSRISNPGNNRPLKFQPKPENKHSERLGDGALALLCLMILFGIGWAIFYIISFAPFLFAFISILLVFCYGLGWIWEIYNKRKTKND